MTMTQYTVTSLFVLLVALSGALSQTPPTGKFFDCRRKGISCTDGTCDTAMGTACTCDASFTAILDYNCVADADEGTPCTDPSICLNGGECREDDGNRCYCPQLYTGDVCELPRIELACDPTEMTVTVRPHGTFGGVMYAKGRSSVTNCRLSPVGMAAFAKAFDYTLASASNCGVMQSDLVSVGIEMVVVAAMGGAVLFWLC
ncbi:EGF-like domain-containing protein 1 [Littorina saxatilis]|uniref:EGF-like domain-containing protein 1 n=1 Tax=Littorina saxatilis TaxID=31220 RepID=UPI0038B63719